MNLFFTPKNLVTPPNVSLTGQEAKHASRVMRYRLGDRIDITDGAGHHYRGKVTEAEKDRLTAEIIESKFEEKPFPELILLLGVIKKRDRLEFAVEKCTELGVNRIHLFHGDHSEKQNVRMERAEAAVLAAMKQSLRFWLPEVEIHPSLKEAIGSIGAECRLITADETKDGESALSLRDEVDRIGMIVGPEGGFSDGERKLMNEKGAVAYSLGSKRLRAETAAITITDRFRVYR
ncbi:MAG: 16S rRNA (uracil(1498)-N(3))-methyltransferase [Balneolaceae bacterium]|nr:16S rRNA (uracil(1498)-N(3))-methyltransferase [Balneolaceae bacterium]MCH8548758.1 16S rRNA (uracil(1498)-N(3))-methyltransferase [Balneolaceae bacterium]